MWRAGFRSMSKPRKSAGKSVAEARRGGAAVPPYQRKRTSAGKITATTRAQKNPPFLAPSLQAKLKKVKLFLCDVDGVLTDGTVLFGDGKEYKAFNIQDGLGLLLLKRNGIKVGWISSRPSLVTQQRAEELKIDFLSQEKGSKVATVEAMLAQK